MKPYYEHAGITIYHGDCREVLPLVSADVMVTDPPYGMSFQSGYRAIKHEPIIGDDSTLSRDAVLALWAGRPALVFGRWSERRPDGTIQRLIWDKGDWPGMGDLSLPWGPSDEELYVIGRGWVGRRGPSVFRVDRLGAAEMDHPTQKPYAVMCRLLEWCDPAWRVVDPFMGSGTTLVAAKSLYRNAIGIEIEERYCEIAAKRLAQEVFDFAEPIPAGVRTDRGGLLKDGDAD
jgi:site-specific DNA-methyltransferase (adenine-specific)